MMQFLDYTVKIEVFGDINVYLAIGLKIFVAIVLGMIIGIDREKKLKTAGVKTQVLICLGATLYMCVSEMNVIAHGGTSDPNRIAAQVVSGIGFLGAGAILQSRGAIYGMTTAATIWVVAAMGVAIGSGYVFSATLFGFTTLIVLNLIDPILRIVQPERHFLIEITGKSSLSGDLDGHIALNEFQMISKEVFVNESHDKISLHLHVRGTYHELKKFTQYLKANRKVEQFTYNLVKDNGHQDQPTIG